MKSIRVNEKSPGPKDLRFDLRDIDLPKISDGECVVEVHAGGINPSDVKAFLGTFPHLVWPRTPGRDYAGIVVEGPSELVDKEVWGTGGDLGFSRDGSHSEYMVVAADGVREKPSNLTMMEAGSLGCAWTCALLGLVHGAAVQAGESVAVLGANGKVGEASIQIATAAGAKVIGVERTRDTYNGHSAAPVDVINLEREQDLRAALMDRTGGRGCDIIMNIPGSPYFEVACNSLAKEGRHVIASTIIEENQINLRTFYRGNYRMIGVSNVDYDHIVSAAMLEDIRPKFEDGTYRPYPVKQENIFELETAGRAYQRVMEGTSRDRTVIAPRTRPPH